MGRRWKISAVNMVKNLCLPMQGMQVGLLIREDPTHHRATKPVGHKYWALAPELTSCSY